MELTVLSGIAALQEEMGTSDEPVKETLTPGVAEETQRIVTRDGKEI